jgi:hypothetical protein
MAFAINAATPEEAALFYSNAEKGQEFSCIGHLRGDFGRGGKEFWSTWWEHQGDLKTQAFKDEFDVLVNSLRKQGILKDRDSMAEFCHAHPEARIPGAWHPDVYGFRVDTGRHRYYIRCFPHGGDYNFYIYCYINEKERLCEQTQNEPMQPAPTKKRREPER